MALLALTSQELPESKSSSDIDWEGQDVNKLSAEQYQALYDRLAADPGALESFLRRERPTRLPAHDVTPTRSWSLWPIIEHLRDAFSIPTVRYATAFGVAAVVSVLVALQLTNTSMTNAIEQSFAEVRFDTIPSPLPKLVLPWEQPAIAQGFAPGVANDSRGTMEFAMGLLRGKEKLSVLTVGAAVDLTTGDAASAYVALGEWNVLLWAVCESQQSLPAEFWRTQLQLSRELAAKRFADSDAVSIAAHFAKVDVMLGALTDGVTPKRNAQSLAQELLLFREQLAPNDRAAIARERALRGL